MKLGVFIVLLLLLASCVDLKKSEQLESMDALAFEVSELMELKMTSLDTIQVYVEKVNRLDSILKRSYRNDTLEYSDAQNIDSFIALRTVFPELHSALVHVDSALVQKSHAIILLKKDIENSTGDRARYPEFISFEEEEVSMIRTRLEESHSRLVESINTFNALYPKVNDYLVSLHIEE
jgi:hypothetical protein